MIPPYFAYVGPGAGFAFLGSFLTLLLSVLASITSLLLWPFRMLKMALRRRLRQASRRASGARKETDLSRSGWSRSRARRKVDGRRETAEPGAIETARIIPAPADDVSGAIARGMVDFLDWREPSQAQHLRFSEARSAVLCPGAIFREGPLTAARLANRQI